MSKETMALEVVSKLLMARMTKLNRMTRNMYTKEHGTGHG